MQKSWFYSVQVSSPNKACTRRLGLGAFLGTCSKLWQAPVSEPCSPQPPVTQAVGQAELRDEISFSQNHVLDYREFHPRGVWLPDSNGRQYSQCRHRVQS